MPTFEYTSVLTTGGESSGTIEAADRGDAVRLLRRRGEVATRVAPLGGLAVHSNGAADGAVNGAAARKKSVRAPLRKPTARRESGSSSTVRSEDSGRSDTLFVRRAMSRSEFTTFIREIATALEAGLPLMAALRAISEQSVNARQKMLVDHLMDRIESGRSFTQAAVEWGKPFNDMALGMLRAGEASGQLDKVMLQLAELLDRDGELRRAVRGAMIYPIVLLVMLAIGVTVIVTFTIPKILSVVGDRGMELPWPTQVVQGAAAFMAGYWWVVFGSIAVAILFYRWTLAQPDLRLTHDAYLLRIPVVGRLLRDVAVGRFTRTMGTMLGAGIGVLDALKITRDTLGNKAMESVIDDVAEQVRGGRSIAEPMEESGFFPSLLIQVINLGERSGSLDVMLVHASDSFDRKTQASIKLFTALLPPAVLVLMASVILFVLTAAILPMVEMQSAIG